MGMGFSSRKNQKMPGAHKSGAAISGPRIAGGKLMDSRRFFSRKWVFVKLLKWVRSGLKKGFRVQKWVEMDGSPLVTGT